MLPEDPLARSRRRSIVLCAVVAVMLLGVVAAKLVSMQVATALGERAWRAGGAVTAERWFAVAGRVNVVERWVTPFNRGVAAFGQRAWDDAAAWYEQAMELAPESARCRVALNWAWAHEAAGDELALAGEKDEAAVAWRAARTVLDRAVGCSEEESGQEPSQPDSQADSQADSQPGESSEASDEADPSDEADEDADGDAEADSEGEGDGQGSDGEAGTDDRSEQGQRARTEQRLDQKTGGGNRGPKAEPGADEEPSDAQAERLGDRNQEAARTRQQAQDRQAQDRGAGSDRPEEPGRTW